ncbi:tetratricopeptide repeat protein [Pantoea dispersa]|uniref:tetratricopeptide repeat protein n=1 Tax=Pantoea dispersa TaxID=59814 RepID=UPI002DBD0525|nr:tetratricopeptide repeat protein [Pantoea dispersa]MEB5974300.1 sel1 repeat family protein [Pantoea dispersa]
MIQGILLFTAASLVLLISGCVRYPATMANPAMSQPPLLNQFQQQLVHIGQRADAGERMAQQRYGQWLASAGQTDAAAPLLRAAAQQGDAQAQYQLGLLLPAHSSEALQWLARAAEQGHNGAARQLAQLELHANPLLQHKQQAFNWLMMAAERGEPQAQNDVGAAWSRGDGTQQDSVRAVMWYRKAAEQGHALAQFNLAGAYQSGAGVKKQPDQAYAWYAVAEKNSNDPRLRRVAEQMKLRMYVEANRLGKAARARKLEQLYIRQYRLANQETI